MGQRWWPLWGLLVVTLTLIRPCEGSSSHSMEYFETILSEPVQGLPQFIETGYVDGQLFVQYDSNTRKELPRVSWIKEVDKDDPQFWDRETRRSQQNEIIFREGVNILMNRYNQTGGVHTWQWMYGCELRGDGSKGGYMQCGYDGRNFVAFDKETLTWTAADAQAQVTKRKWDALGVMTQYQKSYLEERCIEWLQEFLRYGNETLLRKEPPKMKVTSKTDYDNMKTLICRADGFYPKDIEVVWTRDGKVWEEETLRGLITPNSDGTYHTWISIKVNSKDKDRFHCRVDHTSWKDPVDFAVEEPASTFNLWLLVGCSIFGVFLLVAGILTLLFWKKRKEGYKAASTSDGESRSSGQGSSVVPA